MKNHKQPWKKENINESFKALHRRLLTQDDVVFTDFENNAIDGFFYGKITVSPRHVSYPLLCRYEAKIAGLLGNAGFATKEVFWDIKCDAVHIGFTASAREIK